MPDDARLQCEVLSLTYDFAARYGDLRMHEGDCCDMTGCVALFEAIDPGVLIIQTWSGRALDTAYMRQTAKTPWIALANTADVSKGIDYAALLRRPG